MITRCQAHAKLVGALAPTSFANALAGTVRFSLGPRFRASVNIRVRMGPEIKLFNGVLKFSKLKTSKFSKLKN